MNTAVLHKKVLGLPVWAVGGLGAGGVILYRFLKPKGVGGAQADTTPATGTGDASYGDPTPADSGTFPQTFPGGNGSTPPSDATGGDSGAIAAGFASLGDLLASAPPPPDYSAQIADLTTAVGNLTDQQATSHAQDTAKTADTKAHAAHTAHKAAAVHGKVPPPRGGHAATVKAKPATKPDTHKAHNPPHPKAEKHPATKRNAK